MKQKHWWHSGGGCRIVSALSFYSDYHWSNPTEAHSFYSVKIFLQRTKTVGKHAHRRWPIFTNRKKNIERWWHLASMRSFVFCCCHRSINSDEQNALFLLRQSGATQCFKLSHFKAANLTSRFTIVIDDFKVELPMSKEVNGGSSLTS